MGRVTGLRAAASVGLSGQHCVDAQIVSIGGRVIGRSHAGALRDSRAEVDKRCIASMKAEGVIPTGAPPPASDCAQEGQPQPTSILKLY